MNIKTIKKTWGLTPKQYDIVGTIIETIRDYDVEINLDSIKSELENMISVEYSHLEYGEYYNFESAQGFSTAKRLLKKLQEIQTNGGIVKKYVKGSGKGRGGWRGGGRPKGTKKNTGKTEYFTKALTVEEKKYLEECLEDYRNKKH